MPVQCGYTQSILVRNSLQLPPRVQKNPLFKGMRLGLISSQGALDWGIFQASMCSTLVALKSPKGQIILKRLFGVKKMNENKST